MPVSCFRLFHWVVDERCWMVVGTTCSTVDYLLLRGAAHVASGLNNMICCKVVGHAAVRPTYKRYRCPKHRRGGELTDSRSATGTELISECQSVGTLYVDFAHTSSQQGAIMSATAEQLQLPGELCILTTLRKARCPTTHRPHPALQGLHPCQVHPPRAHHPACRHVPPSGDV